MEISKKKENSKLFWKNLKKMKMVKKRKYCKENGNFEKKWKYWQKNKNFEKMKLKNGKFEKKIKVKKWKFWKKNEKFNYEI